MARRLYYREDGSKFSVNGKMHGKVISYHEDVWRNSRTLKRQDNGTKSIWYNQEGKKNRVS